MSGGTRLLNLTPFSCQTEKLLMAMKYLKGCAIVLAFVFGSEAVFICLVHVYQYFHEQNQDDWLTMNKKKGVFTKVVFFPDQGILSGNSNQERSSHKDSLKEQVQDNPFLIPPGAVSDNHPRVLDQYSPDSRERVLENNPFLLPRHARPTHHSLEDNPFCLPESVFKRNGSLAQEYVPVSKKAYQDCFKTSRYLFNSSSLVHMISVLETAKQTLKICLYIFTCKDLVNAVVRAKVSQYHTLSASGTGK